MNRISSSQFRRIQHLSGMWLVAVVMIIAASVIQSEERGRGEYRGVVLFDRWKSCYLYTGVYVDNISEKIKGKLLQYQGTATSLQVKKFQEGMIGGGDFMIQDFDLTTNNTGKDPLDTGKWLTLTASGSFDEVGMAKFRLTLHNPTDEQYFIHLNDMGIAVFAPDPRRKNDDDWTLVNDGPSRAIITRVSFWGSDGKNVTRNCKDCTPSYRWVLDPKAAKVEGDGNITLLPDAKKELQLSLGLKQGEYDFVFGYENFDGTRFAASNMIAFDVDDKGKYKEIHVSGR